MTRSPLYSLYGETISGVPILRAFGAGSKFLRDMMRCVDTVSSLNALLFAQVVSRTSTHFTGCGVVSLFVIPTVAQELMASVNRWLSVRFNMLSTLVVSLMALLAVLNPNIDAALAGFALTFGNSITGEILFMVSLPNQDGAVTDLT